MKHKNIFIPDWLKGKGKEKEIVISSRVRLARNINNFLYPHRNNKENNKKLLKKIQTIINKKKFQKKIGKINFLILSEIEELYRQFLLEKHLISPNMLNNCSEKGIAISENENISILINEEDHVRIQSFSSGFELKEAYFIANEIDDILEQYLSYGFHEKYGYLTACPTNIGTGVRYSVMMHLPGLAIIKNLEYIQNILKNSGCTIRGFFGEGSDGIGHLYQISNQITIGKSEREILELLEDKIKSIIDKEKEARFNLWKTRPYEMDDLAYRAFGIFKYAKLLTSKEAIKLLSYLRMGISKGSIKSSINYESLNSLIILEQISSLQIYFNQKMAPEERDKKRPILFREILKIKDKENKNDLG